MRAATPARRVCVHSSGCSSSGQRTKPNRSNTSSRPCLRPFPSTTWSAPLTSASALNVTTKSSSRTSDLGHYEGRGWRGFHHHASLSIAAYAFFVAERLRAGKPVGGKKLRPPPSACSSRGLHPRGSPARPATRSPVDHDAAPPTQLRTARPPRPMPLLRSRKQKLLCDSKAKAPPGRPAH